VRTRFPRPDLKGGDERGGLPSASIYDRLWTCLPSFSHSLLVEVTFAEKVKTGAIQGTINHNFIATEEEPAVRPEDIEALKWLKMRGQRFSESIFGVEGAKLGEKLIEERLWIWRDPLAKRNGAGFEFVGSGKGDEIWLSNDCRLAVVNDYKTLFGKQKQAPESGQIYALAGILKANLPELETVYGGFTAEQIRERFLHASHGTCSKRLPRMLWLRFNGRSSTATTMRSTSIPAPSVAFAQRRAFVRLFGLNFKSP